MFMYMCIQSNSEYNNLCDYTVSNLYFTLRPESNFRRTMVKDDVPQIIKRNLNLFLR